MEDTISNKCKTCKWLKICRHNEDDEEEDNNMDIEKTIKDCENALENISYTIDQLESQLVETIPDEPNAPINRYGLGQTLYLPVKVVGIRSKKTPNGSNIVLYELGTDTDQRIGFKIFEHASDIWHDKDHYIVSLPEEYIRDHFKEV